MGYKNMNESILKSFDNIMFQQTKMDHKAYIFLGFSVVIFNIINKTSYTWSISNIFLIVSAVFLLLSLIPIASKNLIKWVSKSSKTYNIQEQQYNIFYYIDIYELTNSQFKEILNKQYDITEYTKSDEHMMDQILTNAKILNFKVSCHGKFQNTIKIYIWVSIIRYIIYPIILLIKQNVPILM